MKNIKKKISLKNILKILPHRFPFLLVDKVLDFKKNIFLSTLKSISANDFFFLGHFPKKFIFPGVLIIESIAQSCCLLLFYIHKSLSVKNKTYCLASIKDTSFFRPVYPGDQMIIKVYFKRRICKMYFFYGIVFVKNIIICKSTLLLSYL
ncbi:3-hydroxyacyl-ACP dehydratase FabZ [Buchnera aphidicola]|uniref:3-hydroxyacyl-[acyl-carrier-protein] dehydratase FabZ n=1 Tax=Buchnera aphidicola subsp. Cinara cedri (strain Cc) TaxID=372461 RepID=Q057S6_BUCCC|nr:3-hydroxyacyl-ACP dehydratase FabZ [Buchnera aphidicola]ABJ90623.1 (3R)-hydroxymyristoyl-(acyl carrier protein) dehydratase [Buchnera aphidicola BCc]